ncbi:hypothetical protein [Mycobacterium sp. SP-6446]|uniref:hypothetical protein n=1 Tax=Mycobacterium sp. SP-6446 TaxID=1834162 RepID=UPI00096FCCDF|nr:hypothetical protein [Mycobacterium sp. SP-6446]OMC13541.1 hypothetical protein A5736_23100 [Mycobacterium sp. SP-6446]
MSQIVTIAEAFVDNLAGMTTIAVAAVIAKVALQHGLFHAQQSAGPLAGAAAQPRDVVSAPLGYPITNQTPPVYSAAALWGSPL